MSNQEKPRLLEVGDVLVYNRDAYWVFDKVVRVTATQAITGTRRFKRQLGRNWSDPSVMTANEIGGYSRYITWDLATPEHYAARDESERRRDALAVINGASWRSLETEALVTIASMITKQTEPVTP